MKAVVTLFVLVFAQLARASESYTGTFEAGYDPVLKQPITRTVSAMYRAIGGNVPGFSLAIEGIVTGTLWRNGRVLEGYSLNSNEYLSFALYLKPSIEDLMNASCSPAVLSDEELQRRAILKAVKYDERVVDLFCVRLN